MIKNITIVSLMIAIGCGLSVGCKPDPNAKYPVSGTVNVNGEPVAKGVVQFVPIAGMKVETGSASAIIDGKYSIEKKDGLRPGEYKVQFFGEKDSDRKKSNGSAIRMHIIPERYNSKSEEKVTIEPKKNKFDYDFEVDPKEFRDFLF